MKLGRHDHEAAQQPDSATVTRSEEELRLSTAVNDVGRVHLRKHVETEHVQQVVALDVESATVERVPVDAEDSGQVETLPDGSISVPVLEEQLVIEKRLVVRERVIVRKQRQTSEQQIDADLKREHITIEADEAVRDRLTSG